MHQRLQVSALMQETVREYQFQNSLGLPPVTQFEIRNVHSAALRPPVLDDLSMDQSRKGRASKVTLDVHPIPIGEAHSLVNIFRLVRITLGTDRLCESQVTRPHEESQGSFQGSRCIAATILKHSGGLAPTFKSETMSMHMHDSCSGCHGIVREFRSRSEGVRLCHILKRWVVKWLTRQLSSEVYVQLHTDGEPAENLLWGIIAASLSGPKQPRLPEKIYIVSTQSSMLLEHRYSGDTDKLKLSVSTLTLCKRRPLLAMDSSHRTSSTHQVLGRVPPLDLEGD
ncbi:hypothetical protein AVEN_22502-1 [Araneus ventricosus]|uniref:Uncharacterized protein n=1 Tax=Araneus ventricosus TaxID=182803 RepID=A0A4Y2RE60_ARAVE|nr:hypothetical protein AVEN_22502-1 [Araneus ventricosus]